jgi:site-specific DNA-methyltransferase (adenine-specific)
VEASGQKTEASNGRCAVCRASLRQPRVGRKPRYCSNACRQVAYRLRTNGERKRRLLRLVEGDARDLLASLPDGSVDLIVTDPPYEFDRGQGRFRNWFGASVADEDWPAIFAELYRVLRSDAHAYVFADRRTLTFFDAAARAVGFRVRMPLIWDKCSVGLGGIWRSQYELIGFYGKGARTGNYRSRGDVLRASRVTRGYPTEKPVRLLRQLISQSSVRGELVLDPFCGSGSTGKAARELGRRGLLCDVDAGYAAARLRLAIELLEEAAA